MITITEHVLVKLAGSAAYERGVAYHREGRVDLVDSNDVRTIASVTGAEVYRVELRHTDRHLEGGCECPASERIDFCKHCVAVALTLQVHESKRQALHTEDQDEKIKAFLALQSRETLTAELLNALPHLPGLRTRLLLRAEVAAGVVAAGQLKKLVTKVTRPRSIWQYRQVAAYFSSIEDTLESLLSVADELPAHVLLDVALYGKKRLDKALERVDDSGGYRFAAQSLLREIHANALRRIEWALDRKAAHLLDLALEDPYDFFADVPHAYSEALGEDGLIAFYAEVEARWKALPELPRSPTFDQKSPYLELSRYLEERAVAQQDWNALIALEERLARDARDYRKVAELYLRIGDDAGAEEYLRRSDLDDDRDEGAPLWVLLHSARGEWREAVQKERAVFQRDPRYERYSRLLELAAKAECGEDVAAATKTWLAKGKHSRWIDQVCAYTLARILCDEQDWQGAHDAVMTRVDAPAEIATAARWLLESAPRLAADLYRRCIEMLVGEKNKSSYAAAAKLLNEAKPAFDAVAADAFSRYVMELRDRHRAKRNFLIALDRH